MNLTRQDLAEHAASLAAQGAYIGTSSWKYPGWCGIIYAPSRTVRNAVLGITDILPSPG
ncbi:MAG TPA: hypothetical protein VEC99_18230 [Clostridia bacterium]|nr:hypothetical protein [Clostridia bacterium]